MIEAFNIHLFYRQKKKSPSVPFSFIVFAEVDRTFKRYFVCCHVSAIQSFVLHTKCASFMLGKFSMHAMALVFALSCSTLYSFFGIAIIFVCQLCIVEIDQLKTYLKENHFDVFQCITAIKLHCLMNSNVSLWL